MNSCTGGLAIAVLFLLGPTVAEAANGRETDRKPGGSTATQPIPATSELMDVIRRTQDLAEQSQAELRRSREQNENLQRLLEQTHTEMTRLREEVIQLRNGIAAMQFKAGTATQGESDPRGTVAEYDRASKAGSLDSNLGNRMRKIEDQVEINTTQIKEQSQTKLESDSRFKVRLFGSILTNMYLNTADSSAETVPTAAPPQSKQAELGGPNLGATLRQTQFGFAMTGPRVGGSRLSADIDFDFFSGDGEDYGRNVLGALRMRTASARLDGSRTSFAVGLMTPLISPLNPASLASVYYPALAESGNLWQWRPQATVERRTPFGDGSEFVVQGGLMMPFGDRVGARMLEGRPGYESRFALARKLDADRKLELGVGGYYSPQRFGYSRAVDAFAATADWQIPMSHRLELSGEAFYGRSIGLSKSSGEDLSDLFTFDGPLDNPASVVRGVYSLGGWAQLSARASSRLEFNLAFGIDDPRNRDILVRRRAEEVRLSNQTLSVNTIYRLRSNFLLSLEYRQMWTSYPEARTTAGHLNVAVGYLF